MPCPAGEVRLRAIVAQDIGGDEVGWWGDRRMKARSLAIAEGLLRCTCSDGKDSLTPHIASSLLGEGDGLVWQDHASAKTFSGQSTFFFKRKKKEEKRRLYYGGRTIT